METTNFSELISLLSIFDKSDFFVLFVNVLLMLSAKPIMKIIYHDYSDEVKLNKRVNIFRAFNLAIIVAFSYYHLALPVQEKGPAFKGLTVLIILYFSYLFLHVLIQFVHIRYGKTKLLDGKKIVIETYHSRLIGILSTSLFVIILLIAIVRILGYDSWLEAGGVIGVFGVILALTQNVWAPDLFSGLILLNSNVVEAGDVLEISDNKERDLVIVYKIRLFHTEFLNLINNHRLMIRNNNLRNQTINNLSKFASAKGLRERIIFKISYDDSIDKVKKMFCSAFDKATSNKDLSIEAVHGLDIRTVNAGDYAVEYAIFFYTKDVKNILRNRFGLIEEILIQADKDNIKLSTPSMISTDIIN